MTLDECELRALGARLRHASNAIQTAPKPLDEEDIEMLEEIAILIDILTERLNGIACADDWLVDARIESVVSKVLGKHRRGGVVILPTRRPTPQPGPLGAA